MVIQYFDKISKALKEYSIYGKFIPQRKRSVSLSGFKEKIISHFSFQPVFFLSTGRTGTKLFTRILNKTPEHVVFHAENPELIEQSKLAYELYKKYRDSPQTGRVVNSLLSHIYLIAREKELYDSYCYRKTFIETNNRITFFAPALKELFPHSKFIYLYRHPGEFIRSGIRRNWYSGKHDHDVGRIVPTDNEADNFANYSKVEKIAWLWNETNSQIETFLSTISKEDYIKINFNRLSLETVSEVLSFLNTQLSEKEVKSILSNPVNAQTSGEFPIYEDWSQSEKQKVIKHCGMLCKKYGYTL